MYNFTNTWFIEGIAVKNCSFLLSNFPPRKILEIGSFEGQSTCFFIEQVGQFGNLTIDCIDTWEGGAEHKAVDTDMSAVEQRFHNNVEFAVSKVKHKVIVNPIKGYSEDALVKLITSGAHNSYDFVYIDGSHFAPDVLSDLVLSFVLTKERGIVLCDDYYWGAGTLSENPKIAIDSFTNTYFNLIKHL